MMHDSPHASLDPAGSSRNDDRELIRRYGENGSEEAFAALMQRHVGRVCSLCRRELGDAALAEDAAQVVFLLLARKAKSLRSVESLSAWLYQTARLVCRNLHRRQMRLRRYEAPFDKEAEAVPMQPRPMKEPLLLDALSHLKAKDLNAVCLRFFEEREFAEIGKLLGISEDAARMRVNRALKKMHAYLVVRNVTYNLEEAGTTALLAALVAALSADRTANAGHVLTARLLRTALLAEALSHPPGRDGSRLVYATYEGIIRAMRFRQILRPVGAALAAAGIAGALLIGTGGLRAAVQTASPPDATTDSKAQLRTVKLTYRLLERITDEKGGVHDKVLSAPIVTTLEDHAAMIGISAGAASPNEKKWKIESVPHINADNSLGLELTYRTDEKTTSEERGAEETVREQKVISKLRLKPGKSAQVSLIKGPRSEFLIEVAGEVLAANSDGRPGSP